MDGSALSIWFWFVACNNKHHLPVRRKHERRAVSMVGASLLVLYLFGSVVLSESERRWSQAEVMGAASIDVVPSPLKRHYKRAHVIIAYTRAWTECIVDAQRRDSEGVWSSHTSPVWRIETSGGAQWQGWVTPTFGGRRMSAWP